MTRSTWLAVGIVVALLVAGGAAWWVMRGGSVGGQPLPPGAAASSSADDIGASRRRVGGPVGSAGSLAAASSVPLAPLPSVIDPGLGVVAAADKAMVTVRFEDAGAITFDERPQQLLGLREVDVDGRSVLAVITRDVQSGQIYSWSPSLSFRVREGQSAAEVLAGLSSPGQPLGNVFNFGDRIVADVDPPAIPAVLRRLAQDGRVASYTLMRIEPRSRPQ